MTYDSPQALRTALEHRLLATSRESGVALDRLRRRVLFERVVSRIEVAEPGLWVLKGGMALEVRLSDAARLTKDIDVGLRDSVASPADLHERLIDALSNDPFNDRFTFEVSEPAALREDGGGHPTWRVPVAAFLAAKPFGAIKVDVSPRAHELQATDRLPLPNSLDFAGIPTTEVGNRRRAPPRCREVPCHDPRLWRPREFARPRPTRPRPADRKRPAQSWRCSRCRSCGLGRTRRDAAAAATPSLPASWPARYAQLADGHDVDARTFPQAVALARSLWVQMYPNEKEQ